MKENIIKKYFKSWIDEDIQVVKDIFSDNIVYTECYGPRYLGIEQILKWFTKWHEKGKVLEWTIREVVEEDNTIVVEWYFKYDYNNKIDAFDGVTIAVFDDKMKIFRLSEFESKAEHYYPYGSNI